MHVDVKNLWCSDKEASKKKENIPEYLCQSG